MSYNSIAEMHDDPWLRRRLTACATQENKGAGNPEQWVNDNLWTIVSAPGWDQKWDTARSNYHPQAGLDESVITDADILAMIQPMT
jgi:hypothetical protein